MEIVINVDRTELGKCSAARAAEILKKAIAERGNARIVVATGSSQFEVLDQLVSVEGVDWTKVDGFHLDEYIGLDRSHVASFCGYLAKRFVERLPLRSFYFLDGTREPKQVCAEAAAKISEAPIDLAMVGIGENGHLAFNDPPANFETTQPYIVVELDEACRKQQVGEGWFDRLEEVPRRAISMSIQQIMTAKHIICSVPDRRKADAVLATVEGPVSPSVPASILQQHSSVLLVLDSASADKLDPRIRSRFMGTVLG